MKRQVWRHPKAEEDLLDIWLYIGRENVAAADRLIQSIVRKCDLLIDHPELGPPRPDIGDGVRMVTVGNYLVLYKFTANRIEIVRVVHGARRLHDLF